MQLCPPNLHIHKGVFHHLIVEKEYDTNATLVDETHTLGAACDNLSAGEIKIKKIERRRTSVISLQVSKEKKHTNKQSFILFPIASLNKHLLTCAVHCSYEDLISLATHCCLSCHLRHCRMRFMVAVHQSEQITS